MALYAGQNVIPISNRSLKLKFKFTIKPEEIRQYLSFKILCVTKKVSLNYNLLSFIVSLKSTLIMEYSAVMVMNITFQLSGIVVGMVYLREPFGEQYDSSEVTSLSGALFLIVTNLTLTVVVSVLNVRISCILRYAFIFEFSD